MPLAGSPTTCFQWTTDIRISRSFPYFFLSSCPTLKSTMLWWITHDNRIFILKQFYNFCSHSCKVNLSSPCRYTSIYTLFWLRLAKDCKFLVLNYETLIIITIKHNETSTSILKTSLHISIKHLAISTLPNLTHHRYLLPIHSHINPSLTFKIGPIVLGDVWGVTLRQHHNFLLDVLDLILSLF